MDIFEEIDKKFDLKKKIQNLSKLLLERNYFVNGGNYCSFESMFDLNYFKKWKYSYACDDLEDLKMELGLFYNESGFYPQDDIEAIKFLQFAVNIVIYAETKITEYDYLNVRDIDEFFEIFRNRFKYILSKINQQVVKHSNEDYLLIVPCNDKTKRCAELQSNKDVSFHLYEYTSSLLRGDIKKKRSILKELCNVYEPIIKDNLQKYTTGPVHDIFDSLSSIFNNFNIRHNNTDDKIKSYYKPELEKFTDNDYEEIYDACYDLILDATLLNEYTNKTKKIYEKYKSRINVKK